MVDGFTVTAADTAENQAEYPQNPKQKEGFTYWLLAECRRRGVHVVMRNHPLREDSLAATRRLVKGQCIATWNRPQRPEWMDETTYEMMPASIEVRLVESIN